MTSNLPKSTIETTAKTDTVQQHPGHQDEPDDRYPGTFFRIPGVPTPGKTTWSLVR